MKTLLNIGLLLMLFVLLGFPFVGSEWMLRLPAQIGVVAGTRVVAPENINVIPNVKDFNGYVAFSPTSLANGKYTDTISLTSFRNQKATYYGAYSLYNVSATESFDVEVVAPSLPASESFTKFDRLLITISSSNHSTTLTKSIEKGATLVQVADPTLFKEGDLIWIENESTKVLVVSTDGLVVTPLMQRHNVGQTVYTGAIVVEPNSIISAQTRTIKLTPGEQATIDVSVWGADQSLSQEDTFSLPLEIRFH
ncbi:hypothetical protein HGA91_01245 [candidate division WWE3 bacterium]|nr:hypothetical protein [candidate division WWE3 bacterium]